MPDNDELEKEAKDLFDEVRAKLDDPGYMFNDGSGEEWCKQLRECAKRCGVAGDDFGARQLEAAAEDVEKRGGVS